MREDYPIRAVNRYGNPLKLPCIFRGPGRNPPAQRASAESRSSAPSRVESFFAKQNRTTLVTGSSA